MGEERKVCSAYGHEYQSHDRIGSNKTIFCRLDEHREERHEKEYCLWIKEGYGNCLSEGQAIGLRGTCLLFWLCDNRLQTQEDQVTGPSEPDDMEQGWVSKEKRRHAKQGEQDQARISDHDAQHCHKAPLGTRSGGGLCHEQRTGAGRKHNQYGSKTKSHPINIYHSFILMIEHLRLYCLFSVVYYCKQKLLLKEKNTEIEFVIEKGFTYVFGCSLLFTKFLFNPFSKKHFHEGLIGHISFIGK